VSDEIDEYLDDVLTAHRTVLFMNGTRDAPADAASAMGLDMLTGLAVEFHAENVAGRAPLVVRIKARSDWQSLPQFFIDGQFIADSGIMFEAIKSGQFDKILRDRNVAYDQKVADKFRELNP